jgi:cyclopropane fatty-acyl-phospholipid synthase-like methyltransferase
MMLRKVILPFSQLLLLICTVACQDKQHHHQGHHHSFSDAKKWAQVFEDEKRVDWQMPSRVFKALDIQESSTIVDIGGATGFFAVRLAKLAKNGLVWSIDIEPNLVRYLNKRAQKENITNLYSILGTKQDPMIPRPVDYILMVNTYHHISNRKVYFNNLQEDLTPQGKIVIIDFRKGDLPFGPRDKMKIGKDQIIHEMKKAGFKLKESHDFLPYQNLLVFTVNVSS